MVISLVGTVFTSHFLGIRGFPVIYPMHEVILVNQVGSIKDEVKPGRGLLFLFILRGLQHRGY
jgi:hypothetical protein